jgi:Peptidase M15
MTQSPLCALSLLLLAIPVAATPAANKSATAQLGGRSDGLPIYLANSFGVVTSTYRSISHNRAVGGVPNSYHLQGRAIDIARRSGVTHKQIAAALLSAGYLLVESLDEGDHSHFAFGTTVRKTALTEPLPTPPKRPRLAADEHGTLLLDLRGPTPEPAGIALSSLPSRPN